MFDYIRSKLGYKVQAKQPEAVQPEAIELSVFNAEWTDVDYATEVAEEQNYLKQYAHIEDLGHRLPYILDGLTKNNPGGASLVQVLEADGTKGVRVARRVCLKNSGLICHILEPYNLAPGKKAKVEVVFRGTNPAMNEKREFVDSSVNRDIFEIGGAGTESFAAERDTILKAINLTAKKYPAGVELTVAGHSLGGADTQNCTAALMDAVAQNRGMEAHGKHSIAPEYRDGLENISKIKMATMNSAGVTRDTAVRAKQVAEFLAKQREVDPSTPALESHNIHVGGDPVQQTGQAHILSDVPPRLATVDVLRATLPDTYEGLNKLSLQQFCAGTASSAAVGAMTLTGVWFPLAAAAGAGTFIVGAGIVAGKAVRGGITGHCSFCLNDADVNKDKTTYRQLSASKSYERLSNETPEGQQRVHASLGMKSLNLDMLQQRFLATNTTSVVVSQSASTSAVTSTVTSSVTTTVVAPVTEEKLAAAAPKKKGWFSW